jgi:hypothetical protein
MPFAFVHLPSMMRRLPVLLLLLLSVLRAEAQIPVILRVSASEQSDTLGCNFVRELTRLSYEAIVNGKARLWNSPAREIQIAGSSLLGIEKASGTSFIDQEIIYIYEFWSKDGGLLKSTTTGFLFSGKNNRGEEVEYGYAEYNDLQETFMRSRLNLNANGNYNSSMATYIQSKCYAFKFLQFAGKVINNVNDSRKIMDDFVGTQKFNVTSFSSNEVTQKMVVWTLDNSSEKQQTKAVYGNSLLTAIDQFLKNNEEVFYNLGGDRILNHFQQGKWKVNRIEVKEIWKKPGNEVMYDPVSLVIYVNDSALSEMPYRDLMRFDILLLEKNWIDVIREKNFNYVIRRINSQDIPRSDAYLYQKALLEADWSHLTAVVR